MLHLRGYTSPWKAHNRPICEEEELGKIQNINGEPLLPQPQGSAKTLPTSPPAAPVTDGLIYLIVRRTRAEPQYERCTTLWNPLSLLTAQWLRAARGSTVTG